MKTLILLLSLTLCVAACKKDDFVCERAEGAIVTQTLDLAPLTGFALEIDGEVNLSYGPDQMVTVRSQQNVIDGLGRNVRLGTWSIEFEDCKQLYDLEIDIVLPEIRYVANASSGIIRGMTQFTDVEGASIGVHGSGELSLDLVADRVISRISGSGNLILKGEIQKLEHETSGSGNLEGYECPVSEVYYESTASGEARLQVADLLRVTLSGSGNVYYKGNPGFIVPEISGSGQLIDDN